MRESSDDNTVDSINLLLNYENINNRKLNLDHKSRSGIINYFKLIKILFPYSRDKERRTKQMKVAKP